jgi:hypothetical protein
MRRAGSISLSGTWDFRFDSDRDWRAISVPGCWESLDGVAKNNPGPAWYRKRFDVPREFSGKRVWLRFDAVSYHCTVSVNGRQVGSHTGLWDSFRFEITDAVRAGQEAELLVQVEKPASLLEGPASKSLQGNFPLKQTLSGFLPYVWGHMFGGIWQDVIVYATEQTHIEHFSFRGGRDGRASGHVELSTPASVEIKVFDFDGRPVARAESHGGEVDLPMNIPNPRPWSVHDPALYEAHLTCDHGSARRVLRFGLRTQSVAPDGHTILLNDQPIYPRMVLSWGWYPDCLHSNPGPARVRADFTKLKSLGYNGVKLCLWFPPQYYFDTADETGMLLWVELPMWLPEPTDFFRKQTPIEYERLMRLASRHPSVILYTLGCELNASIGAEILHPLFDMAKRHAGDALVRDNSGGGDAYGGLLNEFAEFYDYHFYSELHFFKPLLDAFSPRWKPPQPWVFGEFCDLDTYRDLRHLYIANDDAKPWWTLRDEKLNPQGARWQFDIVDWEARLKANGYWERGDELERLSHQYALLHRKHTLEAVRLHREIGGYVVTGETDTPISTAGMFDDLGQVKFEKPEEFRAFNDDLVVLVGWDRRRAWLNGGDRAAPFDPWCYPAGAVVRPHLVVSHYGRATGAVSVEWNVSDGAGRSIGKGKSKTDFTIQPGQVREVAIAEFTATSSDKPARLVLTASAKIGEESGTNSWPLYVFPTEPWKDAGDVSLVDPPGRLSDLPQVTPATGDLGSDSTVIATQWTEQVERHASRGGRAILLLSTPLPVGPVPTVAKPFWREAIRIIETAHPAWQDFPTDDGVAGIQFLGCATDLALDTSKLTHPHRPILRRLDARTVAIHDYATEIEWTKGRLIVSTLRFEGSSGLAGSTKPLGIARNIAASYLLRCWVRYLQSAR